MNKPVSCPPAADLAALIAPSEYAEFGAGWRDGAARSTVSPAPIEVIEDLALLLDSSSLMEKITPQA